ncbi:MAG: exodeoxyribonuclease VII small subunit [Rhodocyclaceae bacterium]|jgi:exodeoxyribonuclease VII small subunit|nr:exodeoxyribonuclease VII small subunit [Rhodocyclaceae bacterium]
MNQAANDKPPLSFEAALAELESLVQGMESGKLSLEESLAAYQRGAVLLKHCQGALAAAEQKIQVLEAGELRDLSGAPE